MGRWIVILLVCIPSMLQAQIDDIGPGRAVQFFENGGYIDIGDSYNDLTFPFTISSWVYLDPNENDISAIFASEDGNFLYRGFWLRITKTNIGLGWGDGTGGNYQSYRRVKAATVPDYSGKWVHIAATAQSKDDIELYLNGVQLSSYWTGSSPLDMEYGNADNVTIGRMYTNYEYWHMRGYLDEIRLWNYARSTTEIRRDMCRKIPGDSFGLIGYWNLNETTGDSALDGSNSGKDGIRVSSNNYPYSGAPIGDSSIYIYGDPTGLTYGIDGDTVTITNIDRPVLGTHIYSVKNNGGDFGDCTSDQYIGIFSFTNDIPQADISIEYLGSEIDVVSRNDNSVRSWNPLEVDLNGELVFTGRQELTGPKPIELDLGDDLVICEGEPTLFNPSIPDGTYTWSDGSDGPGILIDGETSVWLKLVTECSIGRDTVAISYIESPQIDLGPDLLVCPFEETQVQLAYSSEPDVSWMDGTSQASFTLNGQTTVWAETYNSCGVVRDSVNISYLAKPAFAEEQVFECVSFPFEVSVDAPDEYVRWSNGDVGKTTELNSVGVHYAYLNDGCYELSQSIEIKSAQGDKQVFIPNVFTPNNDGKNEFFIIDEKLSGAALFIYNRWGKNVYHNPNYDNSWDGYNLASGNYFYKIQHICDSEPYTGWLHLIK